MDRAKAVYKEVVSMHLEVQDVNSALYRQLAVDDIERMENGVQVRAMEAKRGLLWPRHRLPITQTRAAPRPMGGDDQVMLQGGLSGQPGISSTFQLPPPECDLRVGLCSQLAS